MPPVKNNPQFVKAVAARPSTSRKSASALIRQNHLYIQVSLSRLKNSFLRCGLMHLPARLAVQNRRVLEWPSREREVSIEEAR
jgi:hypothetical protein